MCLARGPQGSDAVEARTRGPLSLLKLALHHLQIGRQSAAESYGAKVLMKPVGDLSPTDQWIPENLCK